MKYCTGAVPYANPVSGIADMWTRDFTGITLKVAGDANYTHPTVGTLQGAGAYSTSRPYKMPGKIDVTVNLFGGEGSDGLRHSTNEEIPPKALNERFTHRVYGCPFA